MMNNTQPPTFNAETRIKRRSLIIRVICLLMLIVSAIFVLTENNTFLFTSIIIIGVGIAFVSSYMLSR